MADKAKQYLEELSEHFKTVPVVKQISEKTGAPVAYVAIGAMAFTLLLVAFGICSGFIVNVVGILYPAYMSFKAIESPDTEDDKQWLPYWMVFSGYSFLDHFMDYLFFWVPFYQVIKMLVLVYMFWPQTRGAIKVYNILVYPFLHANQEKIDYAFNSIGLRTSVDEKRD